MGRLQAAGSLGTGESNLGDDCARQRSVHWAGRGPGLLSELRQMGLEESRGMANL